MKSIVVWLLIASLGINAYLWFQLNQQAEQGFGLESSQKKSKSQQSTVITPSDEQTRTVSTGEAIAANNRSGIIANAPSDGVTLAFLRALRNAKDYESLSFHVSSYLRQHPQDIDALMLEAEAYYYTLPLNTALVNYYGLRDELISPAQYEQINQIIDVNTTRIIQQFSGDGSWDLLASFLEPLIQVDPLNRRYLMALAKAYGMQQQTVLMENVLAALPRDDARAQRLRNSIYSPEPVKTPEALAGTPPFDDGFNRTRRGEVNLRERNGQYYTQVMFTSIDAELLIDTGASTTAISRQVFERISNDDTAYLGTFNVQTAGGSISSPLFRISEITVGREVINNVAVIVLPSENMQNFDGLLGMNVIKRFNISYDQSVGVMRMYKK